MSIKSILYVFDGTEKELSALNTVFSLAKFYAAQLRILHITPAKTELARTMFYMDAAVVNAEMFAAMEEEHQLLLKRAREYSMHYADLHHVALDSPDVPLHSASAKFVHRVGLMESIISQEGHMSDLIITGHSPYARDIVWDSVLIFSLFNTGRPVIMTPQVQGAIPTEWRHKVISVAWNGTLESARALYNAMPFLETAEKVHILTVHKHSAKHVATEDAPVMDYLAAHGISSDVVMIDRQEQETAEAVLAKAEELQSNLLVMGAYGHTRMREMILGGVTNGILKNTTIPLLLSH